MQMTLENSPLVIGFIEAIEESGIVGWAFRHGDPSPLQLTLIIDGQNIETFCCDIMRNDVCSVRDDIHDACSHAPLLGFFVILPEVYLDDCEHTFHLVTDDGTVVNLISINSQDSQLGCFRFASISLLGQLELDETAGGIFGWAVLLDRRLGTKRVANSIRVASLSGHSMEIYAHHDRPDVAAIIGCGVKCGLYFVPPEGFVGGVDDLLSFTLVPEGLELRNSPVSLPGTVATDQSLLGYAGTGADGSGGKFADRDADDVDDPRISFTAFPRSHLFNIAGVLSDLRRELAPPVQNKVAGFYESEIERTIAEYFDENYYLSVYKDVRDAGLDPLTHYVTEGWRESRRPNSWFDTSYYLDANSDIRSAGINPFWHYIVVGKGEGRRTARVGGHRRRTVENVVEPIEKTKDYIRAATIPKLLFDRLESSFFGALSTSLGFVVSISQDCYVRSTGGIQLFIADEQEGFRRQGLSYLNISPVDPDLVLAEAGSRAYYMLVMNGQYIGIASHDDLATLLRKLDIYALPNRIFVVHCLLGHNIDRVIELHDALLPSNSVFWLHDFSSLCAGYNLLRNDVEFCGAPPVASACCRICIYGESRTIHLARIAALFNRVSFTVASPSKSALSIWLAGTCLPYRNAVVHPHCKVEETSIRIDTTAPQARGSTNSPIRVAYVGYPIVHKGWPVFEELVSRTVHLSCYQFYHFFSDNSEFQASGRMERVSVRTTPSQRDAMIEALALHSIDLVLVLSPWPETFSYVTFEALASGADVVAFRDSGNVADAVLTLGRGLVADDEMALFDFFDSLRAVEYVRRRSSKGIMAGRLAHVGTTASLPLPANVEVAYS